MKNNIKTVREKSEMTQKECADILGITLRAWQTYEQGVSEPKQELLCKIADMFKVSLDYLLGREPLPDPFADLNISRKDEEELIETYMSFPPEVRAILIDSIRKLAGASINDPEESKANESNSQRITITAGELEDQWKAEQKAKNKDAG